MAPPRSGRARVSPTIVNLLRDIEELKAIADRGGFGTLAYLLECAAIEARAQVRQADQRGPSE
jgi:hypothetical protein